MIEFLLRVHDKVNTLDDLKTQRLTKRGDIISVYPGGFDGYGTRSALAPAWRLIQTDVPAEEAIGWTAEGVLTDEKAVSYTVWKRKLVWFRCDNATGDFATWLANDDRPSGNIPDRLLSGTHTVNLPGPNGSVIPTVARYSFRVPLWHLDASTVRSLIERKPDGPSRPMIAGVGYVVRPA